MRIEDLWTALDAVPEAAAYEEWYQRLEQAADRATQRLALQKVWTERH